MRINDLVYYKFKHEGQLTDVSWRQVKQERSVPHSTGPCFSLSAAHQNSLVVQIDHLVVYMHIHKHNVSNFR